MGSPEKREGERARPRASSRVTLGEQPSAELRPRERTPDFDTDSSGARSIQEPWRAGGGKEEPEEEEEEPGPERGHRPPGREEPRRRRTCSERSAPGWG